MGASPPTVNYKGEVLTDEMREYLFGKVEAAGAVPEHLGSQPKDARMKEIFQNWMFGFRPPPVDPSEAIAREAGVAGVRERGAAGMGQAGLFGFGKSMGDLPPLPTLDQGPMSSGVPYSVPPIPKLPGYEPSRPRLM